MKGLSDQLTRLLLGGATFSQCFYSNAVLLEDCIGSATPRKSVLEPTLRGAHVLMIPATALHVLLADRKCLMLVVVSVSLEGSFLVYMVPSRISIGPGVLTLREPGSCIDSRDSTAHFG